MSSPTDPPSDPAEARETAPESIRVSTLELFFDLVFVFTVTQLSEMLVEDLTVGTVVDVMLILLVVWWMYSGYAWLTNAVAPSSTARRTLLLTGMAGFLVMALAIPDAFGTEGWLFGVSYLVVNLVQPILEISHRKFGARVWQLLGADQRRHPLAMA